MFLNDLSSAANDTVNKIPRIRDVDDDVHSAVKDSDLAAIDDVAFVATVVRNFLGLFLGEKSTCTYIYPPMGGVCNGLRICA